MKRVTPHDLQSAMRQFLPNCRVAYELISDSYLIENPMPRAKHRVTGDALASAHSLSEIASYLAHEMRQRMYPAIATGNSVGFYGEFPKPSSIWASDPIKQPQITIEKENTMILDPAGQECPRCNAPEEQEITVVDKVFSVSAVVEGEAQTRKFIVNAFSPLDAINFAVEILQDEAEDGAEVTVRQVSAVEMPNTDILL